MVVASPAPSLPEQRTGGTVRIRMESWLASDTIRYGSVVIAGAIIAHCRTG
jgi:hypothetical protein